ncbi:MAG: aminotransferase class I/II-fold pyridoxal phosphate-dependent enzyme [Pseudomonadota bacterium]
MAKTNRDTGLATKAVHAGDAPDPTTGASAPPIHMTSTFVVSEDAGFSAADLTEDSPFLYSRWASPNLNALAAKVAALEGTEDALCLASGMAAASAIFISLLSSGDHVIVSDVSYAGVAELARDTLPRFGIEVSLVDLSQPELLAQALRPNTKLVHCETPVNPITRLTDLATVCTMAHDAGALVSLDATFASPVGMRSADLGVDLIMHSATKYLGGHGDALGGVVAGSRDLIARLRTEYAIHFGGVMSPFHAWLISRGAGTLPMRMRAHQEGAVAQWLEADPRVTRVLYPGLASHPQHALATQQMQNFGGMIAFQVGDASAGRRIAQRMMDDLEIIHYAVSLGHHRTLCFWMETDGLMETSFRLQGAQLQGYRDWAGDGLFRLSVGLEDAEDLIADLDRVL